MPVGDYKITVRKDGRAVNELQKKNKFDMVVRAAKEKVTLTNNEYNMVEVT
jgi:hypothetical protein